MDKVGFGNEAKVVAVSGYFDPVHEGHIEYFRLAKDLGDRLIVILNNDVQAVLKKGKPFMSQEGRKAVLEALDMVDEVFVSVDKDEDVCESLRAVRPNIFAKGGDRFSHEVPEVGVCGELGIRIVDNLGDKIQSSSGLVRESRLSFVERCWGKFVSIEKGNGYQVKRLTVDVGKRISLQKHLHRSEHWVVVSGVAKVVVGDDEIILRKNESTYVPVGAVHRLENFGKIPLEVIEVQNGEYLGEDDIERFSPKGNSAGSEDDFGRVEFAEEEYCIGEGCGEE